ncbi:MAG: hypothetical protein BWX87_00904 [Bacteroidetes bacterium ADurb.Bin123]|jgi:hypothetical protein|nr:MAG: hypothetical protein BWX87_00904 [Bacteroidetes bacterium ADurb.Bin123]
MLTQIAWFLSLPLVIFICYRLVLLCLKRVE